MRANISKIGFLGNHPNQLQIVGEFQADTAREHDALYNLLNDPASSASATFDTSKVPAEFVITIERPEPLPVEGEEASDDQSPDGEQAALPSAPAAPELPAAPVAA